MHAQEVDKTRYFPADSSLEREVYILSEVRLNLTSNLMSRRYDDTRPVRWTQVRHENLIGLICTYVAPTKVFIVTELASGGELLER